jgi:hypothetical protein
MTGIRSGAARQIEPPIQADPVEIVMAEYRALKDEQSKRAGTRDGLPYVALGSGLAAAGAAAKFGPLILLALPAECVVMGWSFLANDRKVSELGRYIRTTLVPYLKDRLPAGAPVFGWEDFHRQSACRRSQKVWQLLVDLTAFLRHRRGLPSGRLLGSGRRSAAPDAGIVRCGVGAPARHGLPDHPARRRAASPEEDGVAIHVRRPVCLRAGRPRHNGRSC